MRELRRDPITNDIVVLAKNRSKRPMDKVRFQCDKEVKEEYKEDCPFCRGNEKHTESPTFEIKGKDGWLVRSVYNKYPIVDSLSEEIYGEHEPFCRGNEKHTESPTFEIKGKDGWLVRSVYNKYPIVDSLSEEIYGEHEVMIDTNRHDGSFYNMSENEFLYLLKMYKHRYEHMSKNEKVKYISIFKNFLRGAGASLLHPHSQIISLSIVPPEIENEINISEKYYNKYKKSLYEAIIEDELKYGHRIIHNHRDYLVIVPEITKYGGEIRVLFKSNKRFEELKERDLEELAKIFRNLFKKIYNVQGPEITKYGGEIRVLFKSNKRFEELKERDLEELAKIFRNLFKKIYNVQGYNPFNICIHTHPLNTPKSKNSHFHTHIHIIPRKYSFGGFELGTDVYVSSINADKLAKRLRFD